MTFSDLLLLVVASTSSLAPATTPPGGGTIAVVAATQDGDGSTMPSHAREATMAALGDKGFTILDDRDHAAYIADVETTLTAVGTSVARTRGAGPSVMGSGVNIPLSATRSSLVTMQRVMVDIRIYKRGNDAVLWHGAAVTVRPIAADGEQAARLAIQLTRAATNAYPVRLETAITIP